MLPEHVKWIYRGADLLAFANTNTVLQKVTDTPQTRTNINTHKHVKRHLN
jgi:hypothetical protein